VVYKVDEQGGRDSTKVYLTYDPAEGRVSADID
jgi:hypothetical protein